MSELQLETGTSGCHTQAYAGSKRKVISQTCWSKTARFGFALSRYPHRLCGFQFADHELNGLVLQLTLFTLHDLYDSIASLNCIAQLVLRTLQQPKEH